MKTYKIGRSQDADIILNSSLCSRDHACLTIVDSEKLMLQDTSSNGTSVNGKMISNQTITINYGDEVLFAGVEKLDWSKIDMPNTPKAEPSPIVHPTSPIKGHNYTKYVGAVVLLGVLIFAFSMMFIEKPDAPLTPTEIYSRFQNAVAMVEVHYIIEVKTVANTLYFGMKNGEIKLSDDKSDLEPFKSEGTAFYIDSSGTLITNHHVLRPWAFDENLKDYFKLKILPVVERILREKGWGHSKPKVYGETTAIYIYPNGSRFSDEDRLACSVYKLSSNDQIDLASLKLDSGVLPANSSVINFYDIETDPQKIDVNTAAYVIGFPYGDAFATNEDNYINCSSTTGSFTQVPAKNYVQYSAETASGGSGSPVFNQYGKLVAVTYQGATKGQSFNRGILAKHLKKVL
jgi:S1-C subfamily serine protease